MKALRSVPLAAKRTLAYTLPFVLTAPVGLAQQGPGGTQPQRQPPPTRDARSSSLRVELPTPVAQTPVPFEDGGRGGSLRTLSFTTPDANFERKVVKGSPFSADATTEHVQTLGDGNRMTRKSAARLFRDAAGRTRREHVLSRGARVAPDGEAPRLIIINDPVGQVNYQIETETQTARRREMPPGLAEARARALGGEQSFGVLVPAEVGRRRTTEGDAAPRPPAPQTVKLEAREIEGVLAEGMRTTLTIPAGEFDNEQPLEITHEQWYSAELQTVVLMRHNDPRFGETTYRLTNVMRGEPDRTLFDPPAGYKIVSGTGPRDFPARRMPPPGVPPPGRP